MGCGKSHHQYAQCAGELLCASEENAEIFICSPRLPATAGPQHRRRLLVGGPLNENGISYFDFHRRGGKTWTIAVLSRWLLLGKRKIWSHPKQALCTVGDNAFAIFLVLLENYFHEFKRHNGSIKPNSTSFFYCSFKSDSREFSTQL